MPRCSLASGSCCRRPNGASVAVAQPLSSCVRRQSRGAEWGGHRAVDHEADVELVVGEIREVGLGDLGSEVALQNAHVLWAYSKRDQRAGVAEHSITNVRRELGHVLV